MVIFVNVKGRKQYSSIFGFNEGKVLLSYILRKNKNVILFSSLYKDDAIDPSFEQQKKPEIITFYNSTKSGVDTADQMCSSYNVGRNNKRWPMVIFYTMLNVAEINFFIVYLGNDLQPLRRRLFLKQLAHELTVPALNRRSLKKVGIPSSLQIRLKRFRPICDDDDGEKSSLFPPKKHKCMTYMVETGIKRLTKIKCLHCTTPICLSHANYVCNECKIVNVATSSEAPGSCESDMDWKNIFSTVSRIKFPERRTRSDHISLK